MGVLNVTPDSFSDGGAYPTVADAVARARRIVAEGAAIIDVGGESTRPGADAVDLDTELARVVPVIEAIVADADCAGVPVSVDTRRGEVATAAVAAGATVINDVGASLWEVAAETGAGWVALHMAGQPATMQDAPSYIDVVGEVTEFLVERAATARRAGVEEVWIDPGIGFGKTLDHNLTLLAAVPELTATGYPVLLGTSRKASMGILNARRADAGAPGLPRRDRTEVDDRLEASIATATWAMWCGADIVRVHDVRAHVHAAKVVAGSIVATAA